MPPLSSRQVDTKGKIRLKRKTEGSGNLSTSTQVGIINIHRLLSRRTGDDMSFAHDKMQHKKEDASLFPPDV
jgi:hypothetical protein